MSTTFTSTTSRFSNCGWQFAPGIEFWHSLKSAKNTGELGGLRALCVNFHVFPGLVLVAVAEFPSPGNLVGCALPAFRSAGQFGFQLGNFWRH